MDQPIAQDTICDVSDSCLAEKLKRIAPINDAHEKILADMEMDRKSMSADTTLIRQGGQRSDLFILKKGWAVTETISHEGARSIIQIHHPGDIIGMANVPFNGALYSCTTRTDAIVCPFPRNKIDNLIESSPRLGGLILCLSMIEQALYSDKVRIGGRKDAQSKLTLFILQTLFRLRLMDENIGYEFHCPLNQVDIGDACGMTSISVSRTFSRMEEERLIRRSQSRIEILDFEKLSSEIDFVDRYADLDLSWLSSN